MKLASIAAVALMALTAANPAFAGDPEACKTVRFADVGWTDITATTATTSVILEGAGLRRRRSQVLSVPVTYASLKNKDIDVFLGNWMPTMEADLQALQGGRVRRGGRRQPRRREVHPRRAEVHSRTPGLKTFADIAKFKDQLERQDLRHRAGQRRQPPDPRHDRGRQVRPEGLRAGRVLASRACWPQVASATKRQGADRVPRLGAAPDEHQVRDQVSGGRRRRVRPELRRRHRLHQRPRRLRRGVPERRQARCRTSSSRSTWRTRSWAAS